MFLHSVRISIYYTKDISACFLVDYFVVLVGGW